MIWRRRNLFAWLRPRRTGEVKPIKRLKGLDEFEPPDFVGRMERMERRRKWAWYAMLAGAAAIGVGLGLFLL